MRDDTGFLTGPAEGILPSRSVGIGLTPPSVGVAYIFGRDGRPVTLAETAPKMVGPSGLAGLLAICMQADTEWITLPDRARRIMESREASLAI